MMSVNLSLKFKSETQKLDSHSQSLVKYPPCHNYKGARVKYISGLEELYFPAEFSLQQNYGLGKCSQSSPGMISEIMHKFSS